MKTAPGVLAVLLLAGLLILGAGIGAGLAGERREIHGENSIFAGDGVVMVWAVRKAAVEEESRVTLRIVSPSGDYDRVRVEGIDPFSQARTELLPLRALGHGADVVTTRASFADVPRREIHLYRPGDPEEAPTLTVYFLGAPDTTPEFLTDAALAAYVDAAVSKIEKDAGRGRP
ncbi:MAG TPA: hypothetical protein VMG58_05475 [Candidatus Sulfotelmatobacter sp.]|nr:hypothetical protein [Candidatus Sulfotelmatobacter sp.]